MYLACISLPVDGWNCDVVATAFQKKFMVAPGLDFVTMSQTAWQVQKIATLPRYYFDLEAAQKYLERGQTPFIPAVAALYGLDLGLKKLLDEGMENAYERHARIGQFTPDSIRNLGLELLVKDDGIVSDTVTAIKIPEEINGAKLWGLARNEENVVLAGGQGKLAGKIFRIGHLGDVSQEDIEEVIEALDKVLRKVGFRAQ